MISPSKNISKILCFLLFHFIFFTNANAQVVINEFSSASSDDWVEIYSSTDTDISGWILRDSAASIIKTLPTGTFIGPSTTTYYVIDASNRLNADTDYIKLLQSGDTIIVDSVEYGGGSDLCVPSGDETIGRFLDGTGNFKRFSLATKGAANTASENACPVPTLTPTPTPISTPTNSSTPTPSPTPSITPTPTVKPTSTPTITPKISLTITPSVLGDESMLDSSNSTALVFSETFGNEEDTKSGEENDSKTSNKSFPLTAALFIIAGTGLIGYAAVQFFRKPKSEYNKTHDDSKNEDAN